MNSPEIDRDVVGQELVVQQPQIVSPRVEQVEEPEPVIEEVITQPEPTHLPEDILIAPKSPE